MLRVKGVSMTGRRSTTGDLVAFRKQETPENGQIIAAMFDWDGPARPWRRRCDGLTGMSYYREQCRVPAQAGNFRNCSTAPID
jgi:hypothetical protein